MPSAQINNANIDTFAFSVTFDPYQKTVTFNAAATTGSGLANIQGVGFSLIDQDGVTLLSIDYSQIPDIVSDPTYVLDLSSLPVVFFFQTYQIIGGIKDQDGTTYSTTAVYKKVCEPVGITETGYVPGLFQLTVDCVNNLLTAKELTLLVYNNLSPLSTSKTGNLYYPTGTISAIPFTNTPFTNNVVYTGQYRINCETVSTYDLGDEVYVNVTYITANTFEATCSNKIADLMCCLQDLQNTYIKNCNTAVGKNAKSLLDQVAVTFLIGLTKEINGQDASVEAAYIKKTLNCNCGATSVGQNEVVPINPSVYNIVVQGAGDVSVNSSVSGSTKTFIITSIIYQVVKGDTGDLAYTITTDTSVTNTVKYKLTFDYAKIAEYIYTATAASPALSAQLNALIDATGIDLSGFDGLCVIDTSLATYSLSVDVDGGTLAENIVINGTIYDAPDALFVYPGPTLYENWLNSLSLGTFSATINVSTLTIISVNNLNTVSTAAFSSPDVVKQFASTRPTAPQILQAIVDYLCNLTSLQVALDQSLSLCSFNYDGTTTTTSYLPTQSQGSFNSGIAYSICNIVARIQSLTAITCSAIRALFTDNATSSFSGNSRLYGTDGSNCVAFTNSQVALGVINAINTNSSVKAAFCAIDCSTPAICPDVAGINLAMAGSNIGIYGITWGTTPNATQTVTVKYKLSSSSSYTTATSALQIFPNGNINGTTPFTIGGVTAGATYDILITNNCGGVGFVNQITVPTETIFSGSFLLDSSIYTICGQSATTLYSSSPFASGVTMYSDVGLTVPVTGFTFISSASAGNIFTLNTSTGVVGSDTGLDCTSGTSGNYILGNDTGTICAGSTVTRFTNGAFTVGGTLYEDIGLTTPVTGSIYVVDVSTNHIYNLNTSTGEIGTDTGLQCSGIADFTWDYTEFTGGVGAILIQINGITEVNTGVSGSGGTFNANSGDEIFVRVTGSAGQTKTLDVDDVSLGSLFSGSGTTTQQYTFNCVGGHSYTITATVEGP